MINILFDYEWERDKEFFESRGLGESTQLLYNSSYTQTVYKKSFDSFDDLLEFLKGYEGYIMLYPNADGFFTAHLGLSEQSKNEVKGFSVIYVDGIGW